MLETKSNMAEVAAPELDDINQRIARRVAALRPCRRLSLDALAARYALVIATAAPGAAFNRQVLR